VSHDGWTFLGRPESDSVLSAVKQEAQTNLPRFQIQGTWDAVPRLLVDLYKNRTLPLDPETTTPNDGRLWLKYNLLEIVKPVDLETMKSLIINRQRIDIEQAVGLVLGILPEFATELIPLIPTIMTQSCMWLDTYPTIPIVHVIETYRRQHLAHLLRFAGIETIGSTWKDLATVLFRIRRQRPRELTRCLRLPEWLHEYYTGDKTDLDWTDGDYPKHGIDDPLVISNKNYTRLTRYIWSLVPTAPEKCLRRDILKLARTLVYADDIYPAIQKTLDRKSLAYTFLALQRRLQCKVVSDLYGCFLGKGEGRKIQQNTPYKATSFEERLGEIAMAGENVDWSVLTAVRRPNGVEGIASTDDFLDLVDRVCECLERYVVIHGERHTEKLRPMKGRRGGFRGPVDDWNSAVDILAELRRRVDDAGYQVITAETEETVEDGFELIAGVEESGRMQLPRVDKFLALDIMSWNNSWGDDVFAAKKMPPEWWTWLEKRRSEGKCAPPKHGIVVD
jgi:hypothetical protein